MAADRVATILADPETPRFLHDVLDDAMVTMANETEMDLRHPAIAKTALEIGLRDADAQFLRQRSESASREEPERAIGQ